MSKPTELPTVFVPWGDRINFRHGEILFKVRLNQALTEWIEMRMLQGIARDDFVNYCIVRSIELAENPGDGFFCEFLYDNAFSWPSPVEGQPWPNFIINENQGKFTSLEALDNYFSEEKA